MKTKIIYSSYDEESGLSIVRIQNRYGTYTGYARLNKEEDKENASSFFGCRIAEGRAKVAFVKDRIKTLKAEIKILTQYKDNVMQMKDFSTDKVKYYQTLLKYIKKLTKEKETWESNLISLNKSIDYNIQQRARLLNKFVDKKDKTK